MTRKAQYGGTHQPKNKQNIYSISLSDDAKAWIDDQRTKNLKFNLSELVSNWILNRVEAPLYPIVIKVKDKPSNASWQKTLDVIREKYGNNWIVFTDPLMLRPMEVVISLEMTKPEMIAYMDEWLTKTVTMLSAAEHLKQRIQLEKEIKT